MKKQDVISDPQRQALNIETQREPIFALQFPTAKNTIKIT